MEKNSFFFHFILLFFSISPTLIQFPDYLYHTQMESSVLTFIYIYLFSYKHILCEFSMIFLHTTHTHSDFQSEQKKNMIHCFIAIYTLYSSMKILNNLALDVYTDDWIAGIVDPTIHQHQNQQWIIVDSCHCSLFCLTKLI